MDKVAQLSLADRRYLFMQSALEKEIFPLITEKDYWVVWAMSHIFNLGDISDHFTFRGGTSLSKAHSIIERFSEDVDLGIDYTYFGFTGSQDPINATTPAECKRMMKRIRREVRSYLETDFRNSLEHRFASVIKNDEWSLECRQDGRIIQYYFHYPKSLSDTNYASDYLRPMVKIEFDPRASLEPSAVKSVSPIVAKYFPDQFDQSEIQVNTLNAERTFWEKVVLLHRVFTSGKELPERFSRHYYDVVQIVQSPAFQNMIINHEWLKTVIGYEKKFYERKDIDFTGALDGQLKLTPDPERYYELKTDYNETKNMIFKDAPELDFLIDQLEKLQNNINHLI